MLGVRRIISAVWAMFEPIMPAAPTIVSLSFVRNSITEIFYIGTILYRGLACRKRTCDSSGRIPGACRAAEQGIRPQCAPGRRSFDLAAVQQGMRDGQLVDIFQFVAEADAAGYGGDFQSRELRRRFIR